MHFVLTNLLAAASSSAAGLTGDVAKAGKGPPAQPGQAQLDKVFLSDNDLTIGRQGARPASRPGRAPGRRRPATSGCASRWRCIAAT